MQRNIKNDCQFLVFRYKFLILEYNFEKILCDSTRRIGAVLLAQAHADKGTYQFFYKI